MKKMFSLVLMIGAVSNILFFACSSRGSDSSSQNAKDCLKVMTWNLQTFFDGVFDGNEYDQYKNAQSGWSSEKYEQRLDRLVEVIKAVDGDVLIFEELEKEDQLVDIANRLTGTFNFGKLYNYGCFVSAPSSSIGCALLSRQKILDVCSHSLDIRSQESEQPSMRPIMEVLIQGSSKNLHVFVNHWKSKVGEDTELWRLYQEGVLAKRIDSIIREGSSVLAAGDFNTDIEEFQVLSSRDQAGLYESNIVLKNKENSGLLVGNSCEGVKVYSPWILDDGSFLEGGSYWYDGQWEKIDHFFVSGGAKITDFYIDCSGPWADEEGKPDKYKIWSGLGYSDHFPLVCSVVF